MHSINGLRSQVLSHFEESQMNSGKKFFGNPTFFLTIRLQACRQVSDICIQSFWYGVEIYKYISR